jgi:hypothetical protein
MQYRDSKRPFRHRWPPSHLEFHQQLHNHLAHNHKQLHNHLGCNHLEPNHQACSLHRGFHLASRRWVRRKV